MEKPAQWNGTLIVFDHGGPLYREQPSQHEADMIAAAPSNSALVSRGYAIVVPSYRSNFWDLDAYAEDNEKLRQRFVRWAGAPRQTLIEGQSFGVLVLYRTIERYPHSYDGAIAVAGVSAGALLDAYLFYDTRVVYQTYCRNLPKPSEPQYELGKGWAFKGSAPAPAGTWQAFVTRAFPTIDARVSDCTGYDLPPASRTPAQADALGDILAVAHAPMRDLQTRLRGSASFLYVLEHEMLGGRDPFGNVGAYYRGSQDDRSLNGSVTREQADVAAAAALYRLTTPTGRSSVPVIASHSISDPREPVQEESFLRHVYERAGTAGHLVQAFTDRPNHPGTSPTEILALVQSMEEWLSTRHKPTPGSIEKLCRNIAPTADACTFRTNFNVAPLSSIIPSGGRERFLPPRW